VSASTDFEINEVRLGRNGKREGDRSTDREAERRRTIIRAAIEVFAKKGYHGCRIADVAKEANVAYGLVYHYFKDKDELLSSVFDVAWTGFVSRLRDVATSTALLEEKVRRIAHVAFEAYRIDAQGVRVLILEIARSPAGGQMKRHAAFTEVLRMADEMFQRARQRGEMREDLDTLLCSALLFGAIEMALTSFVLGLADGRDPRLLERAEKQVAEAFLRGIVPLSGATVEWKPDKVGTRSKFVRRS
jgi:TetR/AcrR family fatty acid metabolism transcriptional regulator